MHVFSHGDESSANDASCCLTHVRATCAQVAPEAGKEQVLRELARIIDPDFGQDIVSCGFVKNLAVDPEAGRVQFTLELTTPACPIKDEFERKARDYVNQLDWVQQVRQLPSRIVQFYQRNLGMQLHSKEMHMLRVPSSVSSCVRVTWITGAL